MTCQDCGREHNRDSRWCSSCMSARVAAVPDPRAGHGSSIEVMYRNGGETSGREDILVSHTCPGCKRVAPTCLPGIPPTSLCAGCASTHKGGRADAVKKKQQDKPRGDWK